MLLTGDAGVGKSRLAGDDRQLRAAKRTTRRVVGGQCVPYGADVWWPIAEAIRGACGLGADDTAAGARQKLTDAVATITEVHDEAELTRITNGLLYLLGHVGELADVDPTPRA